MLNRIWLPAALALIAITKDDGEKQRARPKVRVANAESTTRARQFLDYGDARFRKQQFSEAYHRYQKAAEAAPDLAEAYFRQAMAQAALGRYAPAVKSIRRGMALNPDWPETSFRLNQLYGDNRAAKQTHLEQLATAAGQPPENAELMFLLGVELFFDDRPAQAKTFLKRAAELGLKKQLVQGFLDAATRQAKRFPPGEKL